MASGQTIRAADVLLRAAQPDATERWSNLPPWRSLSCADVARPVPREKRTQKNRQVPGAALRSRNNRRCCRAFQNGRQSFADDLLPLRCPMENTVDCPEP